MKKEDREREREARRRIAQVIRRHAETRRPPMSINELANAWEVPTATLDTLVGTKKKPEAANIPRGPMLQRIARETGVSLDYLLAIDEREYREQTCATFEDALAGEVVAQIRRRGNVPTALVNEYAINVSAVLEMVTEMAEREMNDFAEYLHRRQPLVDASAALAQEYYELRPIYAARAALSLLDETTNPISAAARAYRRKVAQGVIDNTPVRIKEIQRALNNARNAIGNELREGPGIRVARRLTSVPADDAWTRAWEEEGTIGLDQSEAVERAHTDLAEAYRRIGAAYQPDTSKRGA